MVWTQNSIIKILKEKKYRITKSRLKIINIILEEHHVTTRSIIKKLDKKNDKFNIMTVYNTIELLVEEGVLITNTFDGKYMWYEFANEPSIHAICKLCNKNIHFNQEQALKYKKKHKLNQILKDIEWQSIYIKINLQGICKKCKK